MGPSVSFAIPPRIAKELPIRNSWELIIRKATDTGTDFLLFELLREVLANTGYM